VSKLLRRAARAVVAVVRLPVRRRDLLYQLARRDVEVRYRGSRLGLIWSLINPLFLLVVYTFVFGVVFDSRWPGQADAGIVEYALIIFSGLVTMNLFSEPVTKAPAAITGVPNYVKKVVFPLELIPLANVGAALFHFGVSFALLVVLTLIVHGMPSITLLALPLFLLPVVLLSAGVGWILASLGVFLRDLTYITQLAVQIMLFLTPVFYADELVPVELRPYLLSLNPMAHAVNNMRQALIFGGPINWTVLLGWIVVTFALACLGHAWFVRTKVVFADVI
jgi:lipopolysaccharide transport system permease protein